MSSHLLSQILCPSCFCSFKAQDTLFIATHADLGADPLLGDSERRRFLPSRFTAEGNAIDPGGSECRRIACPQCHIELDRANLEVAPLFASIIGAPASGKSYFLASATWKMRTSLPSMGWSFTDAAPVGNLVLQEAEQRLFLSDTPLEPTNLPKTVTEGGNLYKTVHLSGAQTQLPQPFQFLMAPRAPHKGPNSLLVLYDNAGEHFLPGSVRTTILSTEHLARSRVLLFLFDPVQDPRLRALCQSSDPQLTKGPRGKGVSSGGMRQELVLAEAASRIRAATGLAITQKHKAPLIVIISKADLLGDTLNVDLSTEPLIEDPVTGRMVLDHARVQAASKSCEKLLASTCPEFVAAANALSSKVCYIPASALGVSPEYRVVDGMPDFFIQPGYIKPMWAAVPLLLTLDALDRSFNSDPARQNGAR